MNRTSPARPDRAGSARPGPERSRDTGVVFRGEGCASRCGWNTGGKPVPVVPRDPDQGPVEGLGESSRGESRERRRARGPTPEGDSRNTSSQNSSQTEGGTSATFGLPSDYYYYCYKSHHY
ncbi:hypothetical protein AXG93_3856s1160 [Marchantia polymorpha subsp. ruderalis]|uniref:Uncharacterized protein n=1 Tax=Marchantia polymorpha subsp. ruderalis TaxID=1480154 RepID=A0A176VW56_MARPO|nr:hypothetical protein AXG93_3856s1160 [Marchantia polymorpha subsp. ruderalis]